MNWKDPLHVVEFKTRHRKLFETMWAAIIGITIVLIIIGGFMEGWPRGLLNTAVITIMVLALILAWFIVERSRVHIKMKPRREMLKQAESEASRA